jgi:lipoprotein-anchoring transpeptidase ErfK/SrfK
VKIKIKNTPKTFWHYFKIYFLSLFIVLVILVGTYYYKNEILCANSATCDTDLFIHVDNDKMGYFQGHKVVPPKVDLTKITPVLPHPTVGEKHIYVDLSTQILYAYEGDTQFMRTLISSGKWHPTVVGNFNVWIKLPVTRMAGGQGADAYDLPNVQWVMYFYKDFGLHAAYWHDNFGHPMSHGCVNMRLIDAKKLYDWADGPVSGQPGTPVSICDQFKEPGTCIQNQPID